MGLPTMDLEQLSEKGSPAWSKSITTLLGNEKKIEIEIKIKIKIKIRICTQAVPLRWS